MPLSKISGHIFLILACLCYSFEWWMVKELYALGASPYEITFLKGFFTVLLIGGYLIGTGKMKQNLLTIEKSYFLPLFLFSIIFVYGNSAYAEALQHTKVMNILILMYLSIFLGLIAGWFFFGEKIKKNILLYAILAFIGIIFTLYSEKFSFQFGIGEILALTIAVTLTATMVIVKYTPKINTWFRLFIVYGIGTLIIFFIIGIEGRLDDIFQSPLMLSVGILYSISTGLLGRGLKDMGTKVLPIGQVGIIMLLEPLLQIITAAIFAQEIPSFINIFGGILVFLSIIGVSLKK